MQESAPEQLELKRRLFADIAAAAPEHVVIGSSTSGFSMTEMAVDTPSAHRLVVAHPFNPPYLIPLVEVVGKIRAGERGGYYPLGFDTGVQLQTPLQHVPDDVAAEVEQIAADLISGAIVVERNVDPIE